MGQPAESYVKVGPLEYRGKPPRIHTLDRGKLQQLVVIHLQTGHVSH